MTRYECNKFRDRLSAYQHKLFQYIEKGEWDGEDVENPHLVIYEAAMRLDKLRIEFDKLTGLYVEFKE